MRHVLHLGFSASLSLSLSLRKLKVSCVLSSTPPSSLLDTSVISRRDASVISPRRPRDLSSSSDASVISQTPPL
ncbi:hypothetical protein F2Q69_00015157 [Brassica cretica]|uniref:Secreted protein n=1 Tax=Brassica cretica TaxID=69181 RepID=A0A8S9QTM0_BRACR|nr:hypothetical protein F2Q69_00015157 [Brassica cretica]